MKQLIDMSQVDQATTVSEFSRAPAPAPRFSFSRQSGHPRLGLLWLQLQSNFPPIPNMPVYELPPNLPKKPLAIGLGVFVAVMSALLKPFPVLRALLLGGAALLFFALKPAPYVALAQRVGSPFRRSLLTTRATANTIGEGAARDAYDHVLIGSGLSALTCAALLARQGKKCLVLEQHDIVGGGTHSYELGTRGEGGPWKFDSGLHYTIPESELLVDMCTGKEGSVKVAMMGTRESEIPEWAGGPAKEGAPPVGSNEKGPINWDSGATDEEKLVCEYMKNWSDNDGLDWIGLDLLSYN